jgi:hypothetical protein
MDEPVSVDQVSWPEKHNIEFLRELIDYAYEVPIEAPMNKCRSAA